MAEAPTPPPVAPPRAAGIPGMRIILTRIGLAIGVAVLLFFAKQAFEQHTTQGKALHLATYAMLQDALRSRESGEDAPVTVVDISRLPRVPNSNGNEAVTSRALLWTTIEEIARLRPAAIGVDIDFGPDGDHWIDDVEDPAFLYQCLELSRVGLPAEAGRPAVPPTPVFIGVRRSLASSSEQWLGSAEFAPLAAAIPVTPAEGLSSLPRSIQRLRKGGGEDEPCPAMGVRLAAAMDSTEQLHVALYRLFPGALEKLGSVPSALATGDTLLIQRLTAVDLSMADRFRTAAVPFDSIAAGGRSRFEGRAVLLGDAHPPEGRDRFPVPSGERIPGVFAHASVAYTLSRGPLFTLTRPARIGLDLITLLVPLSVAFVVQARSWFRRRKVLVADRFLSRMGWVYTLILLVFGVIFVRTTRVLWDDFLIGYPFGVLAPWVEAKLGPFLGLPKPEAQPLFEDDPIHRKDEAS